MRQRRFLRPSARWRRGRGQGRQRRNKAEPTEEDTKDGKVRQGMLTAGRRKGREEKTAGRVACSAVEGGNERIVTITIRFPTDSNDWVKKISNGCFAETILFKRNKLAVSS